MKKNGVLTSTMYWRRLLCGEFTGPGLIARQITARFNCVNQSTDCLVTVMVEMTDTYNNDQPNTDHYFVRGSSGWQRMSGDKDRTLGEKPGRVVIQITSSKTMIPVIVHQSSGVRFLKSNVSRLLVWISILLTFIASNEWNTSYFQKKVQYW